MARILRYLIWIVGVSVAIVLIALGYEYINERLRERTTALFQEGMIAYREKQFNKAEQLLRTGILGDERNALAHFYLAEVLAALGRPSEEVTRAYGRASYLSADHDLVSEARSKSTSYEKSRPSAEPMLAAKSEIAMPKGGMPADAVMYMRVARAERNSLLRGLMDAAERLASSDANEAAAMFSRTAEGFARLQDEPGLPTSEAAAYAAWMKSALCSASALKARASLSGSATDELLEAVRAEVENVCWGATANAARDSVLADIAVEIIARTDRKRKRNLIITLCNGSREPKIYAVVLIDGVVHGWYGLTPSECKNLNFDVPVLYEEKQVHVAANANGLVWWNSGHIGLCLDTTKKFERRLIDKEEIFGQVRSSCGKNDKFLGLRKGILRPEPATAGLRYEFRR